MRYVFRTATGRTCCEANSVHLLCDSCRDRVGEASVEAPPPPDMNARIRSARNVPPPVTMAPLPVAEETDDDRFATETPAPPPISQAAQNAATVEHRRNRA